MTDNIQEFLISNPGNIMFIIPLVLLFIIVFIVFLERKLFLNLLKDTNKIIWISLVLIIVCSFFLFEPGISYFSPSDEEWEYLDIAKEMMEGNNVFPTRHGMLYPLLLSSSFKIFGSSPQVAGYLNLFLACLSVFLVFFLAKIILKKDFSALVSTLFYALNFQVIYFTYFRMGFPTTSGFFILLSTLFCVLSFRYHIFNLHILSVITFALLSQLKPEFFVLIIPYILCFLIFKEYKHFSFKKIFLLLLFFICFSMPFFIFHNQFKNGFNGWCGTPSQIFNDGQKHFYNIPILSNLDLLLKNIVNGRFSLVYFVYDLPNLFSFWFSKSFALVMPFMLSGILFSFFEKRKKEIIYILLVFSFFSFVYLADCAYYEARYAVPIFGILAVFSGYLFKPKNNLFKILSALLIIVLIFSFASNLNYFRDNHMKINLLREYDYLKFLLSDIEKDSLIIIPHRNEIKMLNFMGYNNTMSITQMVKAPYFEKGSEFFDSFSLPIDKDKENYFVSTWSCNILPCLTDFCNFITNNYSLEKIKNKKGYILYKFNEG